MRLLLYFALVLSLTATACSASAKPDKKSVSERDLILLADVKIFQAGTDITKYKAEAALNLAANLSGKYYMIPVQVRDSVALELKKQGKEPNAKNAAAHLGAKKLMFAMVNRFQNMLRVQISFADSSGKTLSTGYGFAGLRYMKDTSFVVDPTLLTAAQRAFAAAENDSLLYSGLEGELKVFPYPNIVTGGLEFIGDSSLPNWNLFEDKVVVSYDAAEVMYEELTVDSSGFVPFDLATRDSIYALFKLYLPENYLAPSVNELNALEKLDVKNYVTGVFKRTPEGAELEIMLCILQNSKLYVVRSEKTVIKQDSLTGFRSAIRALMQKLMHPPLAKKRN